MRELLLASALLFFMGSLARGGQPHGVDVISTSEGDLAITFLGHGSLMFAFAGRTIHVDPFSKVADYETLPKADLVLITHDHFDHLDPAALEKIRTEATSVIANEAGAAKIDGAIALANGQEKRILDLLIRAVPAYNIRHRRPSGEFFHPRGNGNGYVISFGDRNVYVAGDTENVPEMSELKDIHIAFLPMNLPYTMTPEMTADAARMVRPAILYPYHYGETDPAALTELIVKETGMELRIRDMR